jgi:ABC-type sugar transport system ATPase subunit
VAGFLGSPPMDLFEAKVDVLGSSVILLADKIMMRLEGKPILQSIPGSWWGVRPERIFLSRARSDTSIGRGAIQIVERLGGDII